MLLLHYTKQLGKFGFLHTCSPVTELLAKTPFTFPHQASFPILWSPHLKFCVRRGGCGAILKFSIGDLYLCIYLAPTTVSH